MGKLHDTLLDPQKRPRVASDCEKLVHEEVASKKGVSGMVVKTGFKAVLAVKPDMVKSAVDGLLDRFVDVLDPYWEKYESEAPSESFSRWLGERSDPVAEDLLGVTDAVASQSDNKTIRKTYQSMRKTGHKNVAEAVPRVGRVIEKHMGADR